MKLKKGDRIKVEIKTRKARKDGRLGRNVFVLTKNPKPMESELYFQGIELIYEETKRKKPTSKVQTVRFVFSTVGASDVKFPVGSLQLDGT